VATAISAGAVGGATAGSIAISAVVSIFVAQAVGLVTQEAGRHAVAAQLSDLGDTVGAGLALSGVGVDQLLSHVQHFALLGARPRCKEMGEEEHLLFRPLPPARC